MKIYLAGAEAYNEQIGFVASKRKMNLLMSYYYIKNNPEKYRPLFESENTKILLDSGAFTAHTKGKKINLDDYIDFIKNYSQSIQLYANLDVIGDAEATAKNQECMEAAGLTPLATFHYGEDWKYLEYLVERYDYVAIGGVISLRLRTKMVSKFLARCFSIAMKSKAKLHFFGGSDTELLNLFPFYSVDNTTWAKRSAFNTPAVISMGNIQYTFMRKIPFLPLKFSNLIDIPNVEKRYKKRIIHNINTWLDYEELITKVWQERGVYYEED